MCGSSPFFWNVLRVFLKLVGYFRGEFFFFLINLLIFERNFPVFSCIFENKVLISRYKFVSIFYHFIFYFLFFSLKDRFFGEFLQRGATSVRFFLSY